MLKLLTMATMAATLLLSQPLLADEQYIQPNDTGQIEFMTPSGNIGCIYTPAGGTDVYEPMNGGPELSCDRVEPQYIRLMIGPTGHAVGYDDVGDPSCCSGVKLQYNNTIEMGPFLCEVRVVGLACKRTDDNSGFFLSRAKVQLF